MKLGNAPRPEQTLAVFWDENDDRGADELAGAL